MKKFIKGKKTGIALSGGGARGIAHLGALKALEEEGFKPSMISGTSAGSLAGAFYADGFKPDEILDIFSTRKIYNLMRLIYPKTGFMRVDGLREILTENLRSDKIEDLKIPLIITATNFNLGKTEYFTEGNLIDALISSAAIPILFEAQKIQDTFYLDGGIMNNLPVYPLRKKCKRIIAVHVNPIGNIEKISSPVQVAERSFHLAIGASIQHIKEEVDLFIEPPGLSEFGMLEVKRAKEIFNVGYSYTKELLGK